MGSPPLRPPSRESLDTGETGEHGCAWWLRMPGRPNMKREVMMRRLSQALSPRSRIVIELLITGLVVIVIVIVMVIVIVIIIVIVIAAVAPRSVIG